MLHPQADPVQLQLLKKGQHQVQQVHVEIGYGDSLYNNNNNNINNNNIDRKI